MIAFIETAVPETVMITSVSGKRVDISVTDVRRTKMVNLPAKMAIATPAGPADSNAVPEPWRRPEPIESPRKRKARP
jgi:hypothetical protein